MYKRKHTEGRLHAKSRSALQGEHLQMFCTFACTVVARVTCYLLTNLIRLEIKVIICTIIQLSHSVQCSGKCHAVLKGPGHEFLYVSG